MKKCQLFGDDNSASDSVAFIPFRPDALLPRRVPDCLGVLSFSVRYPRVPTARTIRDRVFFGWSGMVCAMAPSNANGWPRVGVRSILARDARPCPLLRKPIMSLTNWKELVDAACEAARQGAAVLEEWRTRFQVREKGRFDLVTEA